MVGNSSIRQLGEAGVALGKFFQPLLSAFSAAPDGPFLDSHHAGSKQPNPHADGGDAQRAVPPGKCADNCCDEKSNNPGDNNRRG